MKNSKQTKWAFDMFFAAQLDVLEKRKEQSQFDFLKGKLNEGEESALLRRERLEEEVVRAEENRDDIMAKYGFTLADLK